MSDSPCPAARYRASPTFQEGLLRGWALLARGRLAGSFRDKFKRKEARLGAGRRQALEEALGRVGSLESKVSKI